VAAPTPDPLLLLLLLLFLALGAFTPALNNCVRVTFILYAN
jgi:hypothetical protein